MCVWGQVDQSYGNICTLSININIESKCLSSSCFKYSCRAVPLSLSLYLSLSFSFLIFSVVLKVVISPQLPHFITLVILIYGTYDCPQQLSHAIFMIASHSLERTSCVAAAVLLLLLLLPVVLVQTIILPLAYLHFRLYPQTHTHTHSPIYIDLDIDMLFVCLMSFVCFCACNQNGLDMSIFAIWPIPSRQRHTS